MLQITGITYIFALLLLAWGSFGTRAQADDTHDKFVQIQILSDDRKCLSRADDQVQRAPCNKADSNTHWRFNDGYLKDRWGLCLRVAGDAKRPVGPDQGVSVILGECTPPHAKWVLERKHLFGLYDLCLQGFGGSERTWVKLNNCSRPADNSPNNMWTLLELP